jgi:hypothetical protein
MSPLLCEKGGILFKGGHYIRKYGIYRINFELKITHLSLMWVDFDENFQYKM